MSTVAIRNPVRCFCLFAAKRTHDNIFVCGRYKSGGMVCLFHLHYENLENYYQTNTFSMPLDCELCLSTIKIYRKEYIAPCRVTSVRCDCGEIATFYQSKKDNLNNDTYFFGCPNWRNPDEKCTFFSWCHEYRTIRDEQILRRLISSPQIENQIDSEQLHKRNLNEDHNEINKKHEQLKQQLECVVCLSRERSYLITPCNHLCCCSTCASQIHDKCPICRGDIGSKQRIFLLKKLN